MRVLLSLLATVLPVLCAGIRPSRYDVVTTNGKITGHPAPDVDNTIEYLGIPYAQPPVGSLRFRSPLAPEGKNDFVADEWYVDSSDSCKATQSRFDTDKPISDCPQTASRPVDFPGFTAQAQSIINAFAGVSNNTQSEDCLTLNIWAPLPKQEEKAKKRPVLVFFHGGRFSIGNANSPFYDGRRFSSATGAIIVTLTYRLSIFGFPGAPNTTQNLGLRDQRRAIEWLSANIANFGGDPDKITIFGQSSGGVAADWWTFAYRDEPIVNGIISESGNAFSFPLNTRERQVANWNNVSATLGCGSSGDTLDCVREKDWQEVLAASARLPAAPGGNPVRSTPAFYPTVDNETVFAGYASLLEQGAFAKIPQLLGNNDHEQGYYVIPAYGRGINTTAAQQSQFLLESFTCPNDFEARARKSLGVPVWLYRYFGDWPNTRLYPTSGAYHGTEMHMLFGNSEEVSGIATTAEQERLMEVMQEAWVAFADDPERGLAEFGWPEFEPERETLVRLGWQNGAEPDFVRPGVYSGNCSGVVLGGGQ